MTYRAGATDAALRGQRAVRLIVPSDAVANSRVEALNITDAGNFQSLHYSSKKLSNPPSQSHCKRAQASALCRRLVERTWHQDWTEPRETVAVSLKTEARRWPGFPFEV